MRTKSIIIGSILLLVGGVMLQWVLTEQSRQKEEAARYRLKYGAETEEYLKQYNAWLQSPPHQRAELPLLLDKDGKAKTRTQLWQEQQERLKADMDKLATGEMAGNPLADVLYGESWQDELRKYQEKRDFNKNFLIGSIVCTSLGGAVCLFWVLLWFARLTAKAFKRLLRLIRRDHGVSSEEVEDKKSKKDKKSKPAVTGQSRKDEKAQKQDDAPEKFLKSVVNLDRHNPVPPRRESKPAERPAQKQRMSKEVGKIAVLLSDAKSDNAEIAGAEWLNPPRKRLEVSERPNKEKQEQPEPFNIALEDLTEQVSAIREYTAFQQDRLKKLQDGYDWNIIRTFCLRIIRCIDNLDNRIGNMSEDDVRAAHLGEVRDELVFALESSGIEQFEPETNSEYRGQEKSAEAVKEKEQCDDPGLTGKIANVIRPGYQYFINDDTTKVVRPAQVKLYA